MNEVLDQPVDGHRVSDHFPVLAVLLILIFGSLIASALPLAIGGTVILGAFLILKIVSNFTDISIFAINVITMMGLHATPEPWGDRLIDGC